MGGLCILPALSLQGAEASLTPGQLGGRAVMARPSRGHQDSEKFGACSRWHSSGEEELGALEAPSPWPLWAPTLDCVSFQGSSCLATFRGPTPAAGNTLGSLLFRSLHPVSPDATATATSTQSLQASS